ncbi:hypothetical protein NC651_035354 [Populus alba x Populus x berolinensis]|nr:hypothetical protein NC651_035354 [Populus alba x Populus x berolinensis]
MHRHLYLQVAKDNLSSCKIDLQKEQSNYLPGQCGSLMLSIFLLHQISGNLLSQQMRPPIFPIEVSYVGSVDFSPERHSALSDGVCISLRCCPRNFPRESKNSIVL